MTAPSSIRDRYRMRWQYMPAWGRLAGKIALVLLLVRIGWSLLILAWSHLPASSADGFMLDHGILIGRVLSIGWILPWLLFVLAFTPIRLPASAAGSSVEK